MQIATALSLVIRVIDVVTSGLSLAEDVKVKYSAIRKQIKTLVKENRDPTPEEWAALDAVTNTNHNRIQNS